ncbi:hypothetical protein P43SY_006630 [Pythium insidiosum]|uniref:DDRGK domain-containing protein 1 n=1 Tax=Pythium insidiosum TaxID=114742 RepID=A0AAD5LX81_PYTIN|nr:hypothetical protein P43SY_006630 [Pythium insidiosum]
MPSDGVLLVISLSGLSLTVFIVLYFAGFFRRSRVADATAAVEGDDAQVVKPGGRRAAGGLAAMRKRKEKKKDRANDNPNANAADAQNDNDENDAAAFQATGGEEGDIAEPRAMTKKEMQKELKRREREEMRRFEEQRREEQRKREQAKEEAMMKKREDEARMEEEQEEAERKRQEEKAKKEQEEFDQWKNMFTVEEKGDKADEESEESQMLLQQFVDYIKSRKVVLLEDLGAAFNLPTQDAIQRVESLQHANRITGIIDDRGKFIYITEEEMDSVAKFINRKGRLGLSELSKECNKLIRLDVDKETNQTSVDWLDESEDSVTETPAPQ